jgi:hypothetical protein
VGRLFAVRSRWPRLLIAWLLLHADALAADAGPVSDEAVISATKLREQRPPRPTLAIRVQRGSQSGLATREVTIYRGERLRLSVPRQQDGQPRWFLVLPDLTLPPWAATPAPRATGVREGPGGNDYRRRRRSWS